MVERVILQDIRSQQYVVRKNVCENRIYERTWMTRSPQHGPRKGVRLIPYVFLPFYSSVCTYQVTLFRMLPLFYNSPSVNATPLSTLSYSLPKRLFDYKLTPKLLIYHTRVVSRKVRLPCPVHTFPYSSHGTPFDGTTLPSECFVWSVRENFCPLSFRGSCFIL